MTKLKIGALDDTKPVRLAFEMPAALHCELIAYAELLARETNKAAIDPAKLIVPMIKKFIASDREFARTRSHKASQ